MKWIIILLMAFFYTACGGEDEEPTSDPNITVEDSEDENGDEDEDPAEPPVAQSAINPNVLVCLKEDQTLTFELKQYSAGSTECDLEKSKCSTACGCELTLTEGEGEASKILLCSNSPKSDHCSQGFEQVKQGLPLTGNTGSVFHSSYGQMNCQPGAMEEEPLVAEEEDSEDETAPLADE